VDDVVIKTRSYDEFITDLEETLNSLRRFRWKLNSTKCVFGVPQGKLFGFIVSHRGIEVNPEKINAITAMDAPRTIKDVQKLTGCMAALNGVYPSPNCSRSMISSSGPRRQTRRCKISSTICSRHPL
jgi:hypothetical protein